MKKVLLILIASLVVLSACLNSETNTTINADGSGKMTAMIDFSELMKMMASSNKNQGEDFVLDTTINMRTFSDTAKSISAYHKSLIRDMQFKLLMDVRDVEKLKFHVTIISPFKTLDDFNALNELMRDKEFDAIFDKAMEMPDLSGQNKEDDGSSKESDNIFASVFPAFYKCVYSKKSIVCKTDTAKYRETIEGLKKMDMDINGEMEGKMLEAAVFTNTLNLPRNPGKITGDSWKKGKTDRELVQSGNYLDLYKNPGKYEYSIQY